jgi:hypothetical protein
MSFQPRLTSTCNLTFSPETLRSLAQDLTAFRKNAQMSGQNTSTVPLVSDWSKTLLPFPAIIGSTNSKSILEPAFAFTEDNSMALLPGGWFRLEGHVDTYLTPDLRIRG